WEWTQRELTPENWDTVLVDGAVDLVLVQAPHGRLDGWDGALDRCAEMSLPLAVWVTGTVDADTSWAERVEHVFVDDERSLTALPGAELLPSSEEHTSELQSREKLVCRLLLEKEKKS